MDVGLQGSIPEDQDEYPVAFNLSTTSQHQLLDCDPNIPQGQIDDAIAAGCGPWYQSHDFIQAPLSPQPQFDLHLASAGSMAELGPEDMRQDTSNVVRKSARARIQLPLLQRQDNPSCPADIAPGAAGFQWGRNYWNDENNANDTVTDPVTGQIYQTTYTEEDSPGGHGNRIPAGDPRLVTLFFTPYNSFGGNGQATYPIVSLGQFYITGYGRAGNIDDPCDGGNSSGVHGRGELPPTGFELWKQLLRVGPLREGRHPQWGRHTEREVLRSDLHAAVRPNTGRMTSSNPPF